MDKYFDYDNISKLRYVIILNMKKCEKSSDFAMRVYL